MNPALTRHIRVARHRLYGTPLDESTVKDERLAIALMEFKTFLTRRIGLEIRIEIYSDTIWQATLEAAWLKRRSGQRPFPSKAPLGHASVQTTERYLGCKQNLGHPVNDLFDLRMDGRPHEHDGESATAKSADPVEKASRRGVECRHGGSDHEQPVCDSTKLSPPERSDLVEVRKGPRAESLRRCLGARASRGYSGSKEVANQIQQSSDLWDLEHYLTERRKEINRKYDFRGSRLVDVLGRLLYENRLGEGDLRGLREEKMKSIRSFAQFLRDEAA